MSREGRRCVLPVIVLAAWGTFWLAGCNSAEKDGAGEMAAADSTRQSGDREEASPGGDALADVSGDSASAADETAAAATGVQDDREQGQPGNPVGDSSKPSLKSPRISAEPDVSEPPLLAPRSLHRPRPQVARHLPPVDRMPGVDAGQASSESTEPVDDEPAPAAMASDDRSDGPVKIEVFYVTDRASVNAIRSSDFLKTFRWPVMAVILALLAGLWSLTQRRLIPGLIALVILAGGLSTAHASIIRWQRLHRLATNNDVRYTSDLKRPQPGERPLDYGKCIVNIPPDHRVGHVDSPSLQRFEFTEDTQKHVILERVVRGQPADFFRDLNERLGSGNGQTFVFIHGYNVSFEDAVKRTAQVSFDLKFNGVPICYSWPSHGGLEDYTRDMANADWTVIHLQEFLTSLFDETQASRIHLIAHSMGNRALMQALDRLALQWNQERRQAVSLAAGREGQAGASVQSLLKRHEPPRFGQIIMAAPDISADEFRQRYAKTLRSLSSQITLYASSRDRALMVSTSVHGHNRAGLAGEEICVVEGIDTIDVSHIDTSLIGHSYYGDNPALINDLRALIQLSQSTSQREWLEQVQMAADKVYWKFR
jgi:esterase/lipase superfamily enzyme